jgi:hypothetical protein
MTIIFFLVANLTKRLSKDRNYKTYLEEEVGFYAYSHHYGKRVEFLVNFRNLQIEKIEKIL